jgi:hypothetical protein
LTFLFCLHFVALYSSVSLVMKNGGGGGIDEFVNRDEGALNDIRGHS